jgi:type VI secretion system protein ImpL
MRAVGSIFSSRWFLTLIGAVALCLVIWFVGPLIAVGGKYFLESDAVRLIIIMVILVAWGVFNIVSGVRAAKTNDKMVEALTAAPVDANATESAAEVAVLRKRLEDALVMLRRTAGKARKRGTRYLYELPWYMFIGPPGSGKTTALRNSGLNFPTADRLGATTVAGVGGTRNCDWLLTDQAVLLDTAGRYTTQDSNEAVDQKAWAGFLDLLKRFRPRQPINGALVAMAVTDIALHTAEERAAHGRAIRKRMTELHDAFGVRFPVYVLLTKADLMAGFVEFFDDLGREEREQVWGVTLPFDKGDDAEAPAVTAMGAEFDGLIKRLGDRVLERLQRETDLSKRALIFGFPTQVNAIREPLLQFLNEIFVPNRYEGRLLLRGVYFTSGTQEGTPFDRLMGAMAASFGVERQRLPSFSGQGRTYFLGRLFRDVIFGEASVVSSNPRLEWRQNWIRRGAYALALLVLIVMGGAWTMSYFGNQALIADIERRADAYKKQAEPLATPVVADGDVMATLPPLKSLRDFPHGYGEHGGTEPLTLDFGLYQGRKLGAQAQLAYLRAVNNVFLPRLLIRLGKQIVDNLGNLDFVQEGLKVYLMLGGQGPLDRGEIKTWLTADWQGALPGDNAAAQRNQLKDNLDALLSQPFRPIAIDGRIVAEARRVLLQQPIASRTYNIIKSSKSAREMSEWRMVDHVGPYADQVLALKSGHPLTSGIPGFYTAIGFYEVFLPALATATHDAAAEAWVLGNAKSDAAGNDTGASSGRLKQDVVNLYAADYILQWDRLLGDIKIVPFHGMYEASQVLNKLSAPNSPLKLLLVAIAKETDLSQPPQTEVTAEQMQNGTQLAREISSTRAMRLQRAARIAALASKTAAPTLGSYGEAITEHFRQLHEFVGLGGTGPAPIDDVLRGFNDLYMQVNKMTVPGQNPAGGAPMADISVAARLADEAARLPPPANGMMAAAAGGITSLAKGSTRTQLNDLWQSQVLPFCQTALSGRYPIFHDGSTDVTLDDFTRLFGPNGMIDNFFKTNLAPYVDVTRRPWRWQRGQNVDLGLSDAALVQFQRAQTIRDSFFTGGSSPSLRLEFTPVSLDPGATEVVISIDGQDLSYAHGPPQPASIQWPGKSGVYGGRVAFEVSGGSPATITAPGPWSLFRLFDQGSVERSNGADRLRVTFSAGGHQAVYEVQANSVINPLTMRELREFRCPSHL